MLMIKADSRYFTEDLRWQTKTVQQLIEEQRKAAKAEKKKKAKRRAERDAPAFPDAHRGY